MSAKKLDHKTKVQILITAIAVAVCGLIYEIVHWFEVVRDVQNPASVNAQKGRLYQGANPAGQASQAELEADERMFKPVEGIALPKDSAAFKEKALPAVQKSKASH